MELESIFEILSNGEIRIKSTQVSIKTVIKHYLQGDSPEEIAEKYPELELKLVYATITYYLFNEEKFNADLEEFRRHPFRPVYEFWDESQREEYPEFLQFVLSYLDLDNPHDRELREKVLALESGDRLVKVISEKYKEIIQSEGFVDFETFVDENYPEQKSNIMKTLTKFAQS